MTITKNLKDADESLIIILNEMYLIHQLVGDVESAMKILQKLIKIITLNLGDRHVCMALVLALLRNMHVKN